MTIETLRKYVYRTKRAVIERMEEDPTFYQRSSQMLDQAIQAFYQQRIDDKECLRQVEDILERVSDRTGDDVPTSLRDRDVAKA